MSLSSKKSIAGYNRGAGRRESQELVDEAQGWYPYGFDCRPDYMDDDWDGDPPRMTMPIMMRGRLGDFLAKLQIREAQKVMEDYWYYYW